MFSRSNIRGLLYLMPIILVFLMIASLAEPRDKSRDRDDYRYGRRHSSYYKDTLFVFDPNTATFDELRQLGIPSLPASMIIRSQKRGRKYEVREEVAAVYGMDDSIYKRIEPYIEIGEEFAAKPMPERRYENRYERRRREPRVMTYRLFRIDTVTTASLRAMGFSPRRAAAFINYRDMRGGLYSMDEVCECYVLDDETCDSLEKYIIFPAPAEVQPKFPVEINSADSATLRRVYGIGERSVTEIMRYRAQLGGFVRVEQLAEIKCITESNFEKILAQICCDSCNISKIDINFAPLECIGKHPYISSKALRIIGNKRQLKGGWSRIEEMVDDKIFTRDEAERLRPYLRFARKDS